MSSSPRPLALLVVDNRGAAAALAILFLGACFSRGGADGLEPAPDGAASSTADAASAAADLPAADAATPADLSRDASTRSDSAFDPASCSDPALSSAQALALLGAQTRLKLADATLYRRSRTCTGMTENTCGAWGAPVPHTQSLLTYSGGVTTDYKTFSFPTHLILFAQAGQPKLSVRHESDFRHDANASNRGVVFPFGADPMVNTYPVIYVWDFAPAPNRYDDLQGLLGDKGLLHVAERCARVVFPSGVSSEVAALYRY